MAKDFPDVFLGQPGVSPQDLLNKMGRFAYKAPNDPNAYAAPANPAPFTPAIDAEMPGSGGESAPVVVPYPPRRQRDT